MKYLILCSIFLNYTLTYSQKKIKCIISDKSTKSNISYTTIKTKNDNRIFCADINGYFEINDYPFDSINISSIGYVDVTYSKATFLSLDTIFLTPQYQILNDVVVKTAFLKSIEVFSFGLKSKKHDFSFACDSSFNLNEFAIQIDIPSSLKKYKIESVHIRLRKAKEKIITVHPIRIHLYSSFNGIPGFEFLKKDITINNENQINNDKEIIVDISKQFLVMDATRFFVGIEFLKTYENKQYAEPQLLITASNPEFITYRKNFFNKGKFYHDWIIIAREGLFDQKPNDKIIHSYNILAWVDVTKQK